MQQFCKNLQVFIVLLLVLFLLHICETVYIWLTFPSMLKFTIFYTVYFTLYCSSVYISEF